MGTIKFELDLPEFDKEIELKVIITKDGVQSSTPSFVHNVVNASDPSGLWKEKVSKPISPTPQAQVVTQPVQSPSLQKGIPSSMMGTY
jgi:hypothetical protein